MKLTGNINVSNITRCYVDTVLKIPCPNCGKEMEDDLNSEYIMYPGWEKHKRFLMCHNCSNDENELCFTLSIKFISAKMVLEYDPSSLREADKADLLFSLENKRDCVGREDTANE